MPHGMRQSIGNFLLRRLDEVGIRHIFGVAGDYNVEFTQQLEDRGAPAWIGTCNELNGSYELPHCNRNVFRAATVKECPWACGPPKWIKTRSGGIVKSITCDASLTERYANVRK
jgi:hypothetical protein